MKAIIAAAAMSVLGATQVFAESIEIRRNGQTPSVVGKADNFSGHAVVSPLLPPNESTRASRVRWISPRVRARPGIPIPPGSC